ncbi:nucleopolyhedrovirus P10 family protein [Streptomyces spinoverrucosus]|uniref:nucleopolyhedrovirus P10 family protein n=1 Tax=Streptomyces spinoverrucosus TaxID=284043 RepID=UPI0018C400E7|nr:nucleopolyhedrovirus P10 family protein [Streptomyces spinoverrucosus]MBG0856351.1 nucleopolyhedrovirus P10 family protein [Streptomyces spinoverrucosus]
MTADRWTQAVRQQLGLGRLLPLGGPRDGAWIAEAAADPVLRRAGNAMPGVRLGALRIGLADPEGAQAPAVPPPPTALPPGPLRLTADFAATATEPLTTTAARLRTALSVAAAARLGLTVAEIDLRVTALLDEETEPEVVRAPEPPEARQSTGEDAKLVAAAALAVPGVTHLTETLGRAVHIEESPGQAMLPRRHVRVELAVGADHRAVEVARHVRATVGTALKDQPSVAVLITAVS